MDSSASKLWVARKRGGRSEGAVAVDEIQRLLESLPEETATPIDTRNRRIPQLLDPSPTEDQPAGSVPPLQLHGPIVNAVIPRDAFP